MKFNPLEARCVFIEGPLALYLHEATGEEIRAALSRITAYVNCYCEQHAPSVAQNPLPAGRPMSITPDDLWGSSRGEGDRKGPPILRGEWLAAQRDAFGGGADPGASVSDERVQRKAAWERSAGVGEPAACNDREESWITGAVLRCAHSLRAFYGAGGSRVMSADNYHSLRKFGLVGVNEQVGDKKMAWFNPAGDAGIWVEVQGDPDAPSGSNPPGVAAS